MFNSDPDSMKSLTIDHSTAHDLLSSGRRRHTLDCLTDHGSMALSDLADEVASREYEDTLSQVPGDAVLKIYVSMYHTHVPKLATADVVSYDQEQDLVTPAGNAAPLREFSSAHNDTGSE